MVSKNSFNLEVSPSLDIGIHDLTLSTVPCFDVVTKSSNQRTEGGSAGEEVVVTNIVTSCKSSNLLIDCNSIYQQG